MNLPPRLHESFVASPATTLGRLLPDSAAPVVAKLESQQISGSAKERTATFLLDGLERDGLLHPGATVVESTSGNLGVALSRLCALRGLRFVAVVDERVNETTVRTMCAHGAEVVRVAPPPGEDLLVARVARVHQLLDEIPGAVSVNQYENPDNPRAHAETTVPELVEALGRPPSHLYVATSTVGTMLGCQQAIEREGWSTRLVGVDAEGSVLFGGRAGRRKLPGLGAGFVSAHGRAVRPHRVVRIPEWEMVLGCRWMARREGLLVGASTGAIVAALAREAHTFTSRDLVARVVHDSGGPYLDTVFDDDWVRREVADGERALTHTGDSWPVAEEAEPSLRPA